MPSLKIDEEALEGLGDLVAQFGMLLVTSSEFQELEDSAREAAIRLDESENSAPFVTEDEREDFRDVVLFITFASQLNEYLLRQAVFETVVSDEAKNDALKETIHQMHAEQCLNLLFAADVIDSGLKGEIGQIKGLRNNLVHGLEDWLFHNPDQSYESQIDRAVRSVEGLVELINSFA